MNRMKNIGTVLLMVFTLTTGMILSGIPAKADSVSTPYLALGADLTPDERETVFSLLNVEQEDLDEYNVLYVTNKDEHNYLDHYISSSIIGTRALSCVLVQKRTEGYGLQVTTHNITYCTPSMYINALSTAGITDSRVVVAGPFPISGTAALVGAMKAYEDMTGEEITEEYQDAAMNELVVEGILGESFAEGDDDGAEVEEFIRDLKLEVSEREFNEETEREEIEDLIREKATERNLELSQELLDQIADLMEKINKLELDKEQIQKQTEVITETPKDPSSSEAAASSPEKKADSTEVKATEEKKDSAGATEAKGNPAEATEAKGNPAGAAEAKGNSAEAAEAKGNPAEAAEAKDKGSAGSTEAKETEGAANDDNPDPNLIQGQEQLDSFNAFFQDEDKTLALLTSIQDDINALKTADNTGAEPTQDQKKEIVKKEFINHGVIPAEQAKEEGADLSAFDAQIDNTVMIIDHLDWFNLDLDSYRARTASSETSETSADDSSQTDTADGADQTGEAGESGQDDGTEESSQADGAEESSQSSEAEGPGQGDEAE